MQCLYFRKRKYQQVPSCSGMNNSSGELHSFLLKALKTDDVLSIDFDQGKA